MEISSCSFNMFFGIIAMLLIFVVGVAIHQFVYPIKKKQEKPRYRVVQRIEDKRFYPQEEFIYRSLFRKPTKEFVCIRKRGTFLPLSFELEKDAIDFIESPDGQKIIWESVDEQRH